MIYRLGHELTEQEHTQAASAKRFDVIFAGNYRFLMQNGLNHLTGANLEPVVVKIANPYQCTYNNLMARRTTSLILALFLSLIVLGGCSNPSSNTANSASDNHSDPANTDRAVEPGMEGAKDNADELATLIKIPYEPEDVVWKEFPAAAGAPRRVLAVFQFTPADAKKIVETASKVRPGTPTRLPTEKWFPKELVTETDVSGEEGIKATTYAADEFLIPPFTEGRLSRVDNTDFFVLEVFAK